MTRVILVVAMLSLGCSGGQQQETEDEAEYAPIGPGSDSSALISPDKPQSREAPTTPPRTATDSL